VRKCLALLGLALATPCHADDWFGRDKSLHFGYSTVFGATATSALPLVLERDAGWLTCTLGAGLGFIPGIAKEVWDFSGRGDPSARDLAWDALGSLSGAGLTCALQHLWRLASP
jgi:putative lipoprotein